MAPSSAAAPGGPLPCSVPEASTRLILLIGGGCRTAAGSDRIVYLDGRPVGLTEPEFGLLYALVRRRGALATRRELASEVWGPDGPGRPWTVDGCVARLRHKLEPDPAHPRHLLTALAFGYRFQPAGAGESPVAS